ncbi:MAG: hypothetical protein ACOYJQ_05285 [Pseudochelatococcus sp.]|jgi:hypothetical protein|uniref:hypothetical protein n=1 Tax=Pseudochelatococcus sp. TaxID=2020869 RepID=UPI003D8E9049
MTRAINRTRVAPKAAQPRKPPCRTPRKGEEAIAGFIRVLEKLDAAPGPKQTKALGRAPEGR